MSAPYIYEQETAAEDLRNLLQAAGQWVFLNHHERANDAGIEILATVVRRAQSALAKIEHPEEYTCSNPNCQRGHVGHGRTEADQRCPQCRYVEES